MNGEIKILTEQELRGLIALDQNSIACIENAFYLLATKPVIMPPILSFEIPEYNGEVDVKTAYVPGLDGFALKVSPGFFDNPKIGLPSLNGLMILFDAKTGLLKALMLDNGYLTNIRTAAAGAVAAKYLSRENSKIAGILGAGHQARLQLKALTLVRDIKEALIWGRHHGKAQKCAKDCSEELGIMVTAAKLNDVMERADIIVTTTPSRIPLIDNTMIRNGQHITAMGSDAAHKVELAPDVILNASCFICDRLSQSQKLGELRLAIAEKRISKDTSFLELGELIANPQGGRKNNEEITICDLTGTGVQDTAIANLAYDQALKMKIGTMISKP